MTTTEYKQPDPTTFEWYEAALKGEQLHCNSNEPMTGYYRSRNKNKTTQEITLKAVAYWWHKGELFCRVNNVHIEKDKAIAQWPFVSKNPIPFAMYDAFIKDGMTAWPDEHVIKAAAEKEAPAVTSGAPADVSLPAADAKVDPLKDFQTKIENAKTDVAQYATITNGKVVGKIDSDELAARAQSLRSQLTALSGQADKVREGLVRPHIDAQRTINGDWNPMIKSASDYANGIRTALEAWEDTKREHARIAAAAAEKLRIEQEAEAKAAAEAADTEAMENGLPTPLPVEPKPAPVVASNAPPPSSQIRGGTGRAASVGTIKVATIVDQALVYEHFKTQSDVVALLQKLANAAVNAGITVPGTTVEEKAKIK